MKCHYHPWDPDAPEAVAEVLHGEVRAAVCEDHLRLYEAAPTVDVDPESHLTTKQVWPLWRPITRLQAYRGDHIRVTTRNGATMAGTMLGWGPRMLRMRTTEGSWTELSVSVLDKVERHG
jgi:hypothetical protein